MHRIQTAISDALQSASVAEASLFCTPGHKRGQAIPQQMQNLIGLAAYQADLPDLPGLGLFEPQSAVMAAQTLAAETFGADQTWFLVNGATVGMLAAILSVCGPGDKIILPRNVHRSAIGGLILSGALPIFVCPEYDPQTDLVHGTSVHSIAQALAQHPDVKAIFTVSPTYHGVCGDITAIAQLAHRANVPFIVDEAHGAHFGLHPSLPNSALAAGADLVVQSTHKTLGALTQAALLHRQGNRIDGTKVTATLQLLQSSSPSNLLLASLEAACAQIATQGDCLMAKTLTQAQQARQRIAALPNLTVLEKPLLPTPGFADLDTTRLTVTVSGLGLDGFEADELCTSEFGVIAELPTLR
ncbi:MAG TPA: aminotransferase class I/II-fold pyridoxal phosphate-dependent enzyme, partial [Stenomitos sp.]